MTSPASGLLALVFDTETTGLPDFSKPADHPDQPRICSVAAVLVGSGWRELEFFHRFVRPDGWTVPEDATRIHGLTTEKLEHVGNPIASVLDDFIRLQAIAGLIAGYGVNFDLKMMRGELRRTGRDDLYGATQSFCVMRAATAVCRMPPTDAMMASGRKSFKTPKLGEAHQILFGEPLEGAHDALTDVRATIRVWRHLEEMKAAA